MAQAPVLNKLYNMANQDQTLKDKLKFIAVGKDNDNNAMKMWKVFHKVPFPIIADPDAMFAKALNFSNYPVTMVLDKSGKIVWVHVGAFDNAEEALKGIKAVVK
ncbi:MAG: TlpA disulfide reductase family protein [Deltaproteobacteria bacterium]|nr:TlpA disulfide reductase family protein [Deltaproteobacteria bacterium]